MTNTGIEKVPTAVISDPSEVFHRLGGLHDAELEQFTRGADVFTIRVDDLFANFLGLPQYRGRLPAAICFSGIRELSMVIDSCDRVTIYSLHVQSKASDKALDVEIRLAPSGMVRLRCTAIAGDFDPATV